MFLGPIIYRIKSADDKKVAVYSIEYNDLNKKYIVMKRLRDMKICVPRMINNTVDNENRNKLIIYLAKTLVQKGKQVLLLSDRRNHLSYLYGKINEFTKVDIILEV